MAKSIIALYDDPMSASNAVRDLLENGFESEAVSLLFPAESGRSEELLSETGIGVAIGDVNDGLAGALMGMDLSRELAESFADGIRGGGVLVILAAPQQRTGWAEDILNRYRPVDIDPRSALGRTNGQENENDGPALAALDQDFEDYEPSFRDHFRRRVLRNVTEYEKYRPAYFYGFTLATGNEFQDAGWEEIEPKARRHWEELDPGSWDRYRDIVKAAWNETRAAADRAKDG